MADINLHESNLYQNGRVYELGGGLELLQRERYPADGSPTDSVVAVTVGQDLRLLAFARYLDKVARPDNYWWLIADRNNVFNPLFGTATDDDGVEFDVTTRPVLIPNVLRQKPLF